MEGMRAPCPLWAVRELSVPDLGHQGALPHTGPACVPDKTASFSVQAWFSWTVCTTEHARTGSCLYVHTLVCVYMLRVDVGLGKTCVLRGGVRPQGARNPILSLAFARKTLPRF